MTHTHTPSPHDPLHAIATFNGMQETLPDAPWVELWTLDVSLFPLTVGSTYARATIERALTAQRALVLDVLVERASAAPHSCHGVN